MVDEHFGSITEFVSHDGRFMASGGDFGFHQAIVRRVVDRYRRFVEGAERRALRWEELPEGGARPFGTPITFRFSRRIPDLDYFLDQLFSAREPFRLWGLPRHDGEGFAEVEAVDLHVGQRLRFDITNDGYGSTCSKAGAATRSPGWLRICSITSMGRCPSSTRNSTRA